ncbi:MAG: OmpA family protein [Bacteroidales bacterium]|nr:OmpA family protein [Bacteroidales bacterium]MBD5217003.1 OmpA family protein [Bacteroidales bacterium]
MKKIVLLALATVALCGASKANAQEVTYVEDCSQGVLMNRNADNWFITAQGGANVLVGYHDVKVPEFKNRIGAQAGLFVGKWVSPVFGFRFGASWVMPKGATTADGTFRKMNDGAFDNGYYPQKFMGIGGEFDVMINLTNWWCGYKPNRVYNAVLHGGAGARWNLRRAYKDGNLEWRASHDDNLYANIGLQNNFRVAKHLDIFIDLQAEGIDFDKAELLPSVNAGLTYHFGKNEWNCPVTAVCPTWKYTDAEGDALVANLNAAQNEIGNLKRQIKMLQDENNGNSRDKGSRVYADCERLATIYYPINQSSLSAREKNILRSVAGIMNQDTNKQYLLTGWADNYTGNDEINTRLREARVNGVKNYLVSCGVAESQLDATINNGNLEENYGADAAPLDRAVTIQVKK